MMIKRRLIWVLLVMGTGIAVLSYHHTYRLARSNNTAIADANAGKWREARSAYHEAMVLAPDEALPYFNIADLLITRNDWSGAEKALLQAITTGDETIIPKAYYNLGNLYYEIGEYEKAISAYQNALLLNPQAENARYNLELALLNRSQATPTPQATEQPQPTQPPDTDGDTPDDVESDGDLAELLPTTAPIGIMSLEEAEQLLNQLQGEQQALGGVFAYQPRIRFA